MLDRVMMLALNNPGALVLVGRLLSGAAFALAMLGWRLHKVAGRVERRTGFSLPPLEDFLPRWLYWAIPETPIGWGTVIAALLFGLFLMATGRRFKRMLR